MIVATYKLSVRVVLIEYVFVRVLSFNWNILIISNSITLMTRKRVAVHCICMKQMP